MALRSSLVVSPPDPELVRELTELAFEIENRVERARPLPCDELVARVRELTGTDRYDEKFFGLLHGASSPKEFAQRAALGVPRPRADLTREEITELINEVVAVNEPFSGYYLELLISSFPHSIVSDVIFWPDRERTPPEMADEIMLRERLWQEGGDALVRARLVKRATEVLADPSSPLWAQSWARTVLPRS